MRKVIVGLLMAVALSGCTATSALKTVTSAISGSDPGITAQVGQENTKQGLGVKSEVTKTESVKVGAVSGSAQVANTTNKKEQQVETGTVTANKVTITTTNPYPLLWSFAIGMCSVLGLVFWFVPTPKQILARTREETKEVQSA